MTNNIDPEDIFKIEESLTLLDKIQTTPIYGVLEEAGTIDQLIEAGQQTKEAYHEVMDIANTGAKVFNQAVFDVGAHTYNAAAIPLNALGEFFGYNPGFSGERFMEQWFGDYVGASPRFDPNKPWGTDAPAGGKTSWSDEQAAINKRNEIIKAQQPPPLLWSIDDINELMSFDEDERNSIIAQFTPEEKASWDYMMPSANSENIAQTSP